MDFKKNMYWIVLAVIVLFALVAYPLFVTDVEVSASAKKDACDAKVKKIHDLAAIAGNPDAIKTPAHVDKAKDYRQKVEGQIKDLAAAIKEWKIDLKFSDQPPVPVIPFDGWLGTHRDDLYKRLGDAKIAFPAGDFDKLTFKDNHTMDSSTTEATKRPYRLKRMAIVEEVVGTLLKKPAKQDLVDISPVLTAPWWNETSKPADAGVLRIDALTILDPVDAQKRIQTNAADVNNQRAGRTDQGGGLNAPAIVGLPYQITTVDVEFVAPFIAVPGLVKALEMTERYHAVLTKLDVTRSALPYPSADQVTKPGSDNALVNSYYREGPVKVAVSFDIYEFDSVAEKDFISKELNPAPAPAAAAKKQP